MTTKKIQPKEALVISHTHWDREWYKSFQGFRYYLIKVVDGLLDLLEQDPEYRYFHMDGQTVVLEDYEEIRPERLAELKKQIQNNRILIGPWYDLPDLFIVDGESLVRNLQFGFQMCREWKAEPLKLGYAVDLFGHNSQMPQIYAGFGIQTATLFRGVNAQAAGAEFIWEGADGTECLVFRLCDNKAYSNFWYTFRPMMTQDEEYSEEKVRQGLEEIIRETASQSATPYLLFMDGVDHIPANPLTTRIIREASASRKDIRFSHATFTEYIKKVTHYLRNNGKVALKRLKGELRIPNKDGNLNRLTPDVGSSRIYLKTMNKECEIALIRWYEPLCVVANALGIAHPPGFLKLAWKYLLRNHPHDSICGCSIDQVHRDMEYRFDQTRLIATEAVGDLLKEISSRVDTSQLNDKDRGVLLFNVSRYTRTGVMQVSMDLPDEILRNPFTLQDSQGKEIPYQIHEMIRYTNRVYYEPIKGARHHMPGASVRMSLEHKGIPPLGYSMIMVKPALHPAPNATRLISEEPEVLENDSLRVQFTDEGLLDILHKPTGRWFRGLHNFEDCGEVGDLWVHKEPAADRVVRGAKSARITLLRNGILEATYRVEYTLELPARATSDFNGRSAEVRLQTVISDFTLTRTSPFVRVETVINNNIRDHRLRVLFPTGIQTDYSHAASQFDVVKRTIQLPDTRDWREQVSEINPNQGFVDVNNGKVGLAIVNFGLPEHAVRDDEQRTIALTLIRAVHFTVGTEGEDGAECLRELRFRYGIYPHAKDWSQAGLYQILEENNLDLKSVVVKRQSGKAPAEKGFLEITPDSLVLSSFRNVHGQPDEAVVRVYNPTDKAIKGVFRVHLKVTSAVECDLDDQPTGKKLPLQDGIRIQVGPKKIQSIRLKISGVRR